MSDSLDFGPYPGTEEYRREHPDRPAEHTPPSRWQDVRRGLLEFAEYVESKYGRTKDAIPPALRLAVARADQFDGLVAALRAAQQFIRNGCEFGYIRMPERPDSAVDTLPLIEAALAGAQAVKETR